MISGIYENSFELLCIGYAGSILDSKYGPDSNWISFHSANFSSSLTSTSLTGTLHLELGKVGVRGQDFQGHGLLGTRSTKATNSLWGMSEEFISSLRLLSARKSQFLICIVKCWH